MGDWGSHTARRYSPFEQAVRWLSPEAKTAMYAAAKGSLIERGTWGGCAFNQAGDEVEQHVSSITAAARVFNMPEKSVSNFISQWDSLQGTDGECTEQLIAAIEKFGIMSSRGSVRVVSLEVFSGSEDYKREVEMEKELQEMIADGKAEFVENACAMANLLAGARA